VGTDGGRSVRFTFDTIEERREWDAYAAERGEKLSALAKRALFQYRTKNPSKADRRPRSETGAANDADSAKTQKTPAPLAPTANITTVTDRKGETMDEDKMDVEDQAAEAAPEPVQEPQSETNGPEPQAEEPKAE